MIRPGLDEGRTADEQGNKVGRGDTVDRRRNVLLTCGGKWVGIVLQMLDTLRLVPELSGGRVYVADSEPTTPGGHVADASFQVPEIRDPHYVSKLLDLCREECVRVLLPLIDIDLVRLAPHLDAFREIGTTVVCPSQALVDMSFDKGRFDAYASSQGIRVPRAFTEEDFDGAPYPLFFKPSQGFGSRGTGVADNAFEARRALEKDSSLIFQEYLMGVEISVDGFVSRSGEIVHAVQRTRDKVVGGESVRSHTVKREPVRRVANQVLTALARLGFHGPVNIQCFDSEDPVVFDVNLRLGVGGSALSNMATSGHFYASILQEACGGFATRPPHEYEKGLCMYKYLGDLFHGTDGEVRNPARAHKGLTEGWRDEPGVPDHLA